MRKTRHHLYRAGLAIVVAGFCAMNSTRASNLNLDFSSSGGTIVDSNGVATGFTARMPGTGTDITGNDTNLVLNTTGGVLQMHTSPGVDFSGSVGLPSATVVGVNLSSLGFSGANDFSATATFKNITNFYLNPDQLCLVVGTDGANLIRAGFINFSQFHSNAPAGGNEMFGVDTVNGGDLAPRFFGSSVGDTMTVEISRTGGAWSVKVNGVDRMPNANADGTGTPAPPTFLDEASDLFVGVIAMDVGNDSPWNVDLDTFSVSVIEGQTKPEITSQPQKQIINEGNPATFSVSVTPETESPRSYQWTRNGVALDGQTSNTLTINPITSDAGSYAVIINNPLGSITSSVAPLYVIQPSGTFSVDFNSADGGITDSNGVGIGFPSRLSGTAGALPASDTNLFLNTADGTLEITTTSSDYNGGNGLDVNENLGVQLSTIGFTGAQDLNVTALFPQPFPTTAMYDQFGIIVGPNSLAHTRAGSITFATKERYSENVHTNDTGVPINDGGQYFGFAFDSTIPMNVLIARTAGVWHSYIDGVQWDVLTQPTYLNTSTDMFAGIFAEDVANGIHKVVSVDSFKARVFDGPKLNVSIAGGNLNFTWNVSGPVTIQSSTNLADPNGWTTAATPTSDSVSLPMPVSDHAFYRLGLP